MKKKYCLIIILLAVVALSANADGLVPCTGTDCSFCHFFKLFQNIFNFIVGTLVPIVAVGMVVWGGFMLMISRGDQGAVTKGRNILKNTFLGLIVVYASFVAASLVVGFFAVKTGAVDFGFSGNAFNFNCRAVAPAIDLSEYFSGGRVTVTIPATVPADQRLSGMKASAAGNFLQKGDVNLGIVDSVATAFEAATADSNLKDLGISLGVASAKRTLAEQQQLVAKNCSAGAASSSACHPETCIPKDTDKDGVIDGNNCPHISGQALDVWGVTTKVNPDGSKKADQCYAESTCQQEVIKAMKAQGFCVLASEPWHFEKPKVSANCR